MTTDVLTDQDRYADAVTSLLSQQGLLNDEEEIRHYLRGW